MSERVFIDTNILLYMVDTGAGAKTQQATELVKSLIADDRAVVSTQVLQEFYSVATRKLGLSAEIAREHVEAFSQLPVIVVDPHLILGAIDLQRLNRISFWDALLIKCANAGRCGLVITEDLDDGQSIDGVTIMNPFRKTKGTRAERYKRGKRAA